MANRFFTVLVIPEKGAKVRKVVLPAWLVRGGALLTIFVAVLGAVMLLDYWYVLGQIDENRNLKVEARRLRQQVQVYRSKMENVERTMERVRTFTTRLKVITNVEDRESIAQRLNEKLPDAATNIGVKPTAVSEPMPELLAQAETETEANTLREDHRRVNEQLASVSESSLDLEQSLQDLYELLADQKSFLAALPTRKPAVGYFTSGFGVRRSPYGDRDKMHEGLDIANRPGTPIKSPANGTVVFTGRKPGYGRTVVLDHGYGLETWYAHSSQILVKQGQKIRRGEPVALMGSSGRSTGPHLHYEVHVNGIPVDPLDYILVDN